MHVHSPSILRSRGQVNRAITEQNSSIFITASGQAARKKQCYHGLSWAADRPHTVSSDGKSPVASFRYPICPQLHFFRSSCTLKNSLFYCLSFPPHPSPPTSSPLACNAHRRLLGSFYKGVQFWMLFSLTTERIFHSNPHTVVCTLYFVTQKPWAKSIPNVTLLKSMKWFNGSICLLLLISKRCLVQHKSRNLAHSSVC